MNNSGKGWFASRFEPDQITQMIQRHQEGTSPLRIAKEMQCSVNAVRKYLKIAGVYAPQKKSNSGIYTIDESFFRQIDTEEKAYVLGFIAADGCVQTSKKGNSVAIGLKRSDADHLEKLKHCMNSNHPVKNTTSKAKGKTHLKATITIWSKSLVCDLINCGIVPRKSYCLQWPKGVPDNLVRHFIRGYFDGDGSWYLQKGKYPAWSVVGHSDFIKALQQRMMADCELPKNELGRTKKEYTKRVSYTGGNQCRKLYKYMYDNATIVMDRKWNKVVELLWGNSATILPIPDRTSEFLGGI